MRNNKMEKNNEIKKNSNRRQEREEAFILVFERMFKDDGADEVFESATEARDAEIGKFTKTLVNGVYDNLEAIDIEIEKNLKTWKKNRISRVALTLLRIAVYEILFINNIPMSVSINESVELCKKYASEHDASFLNGVLGGVARSHEKNAGVE